MVISGKYFQTFRSQLRLPLSVLTVVVSPLECVRDYVKQSMPLLHVQDEPDMCIIGRKNRFISMEEDC